MGARLTSDFWVSAYLRRVMAEGAFAALRRRGAAEAGTIFVKLDLLDGRVRLYGPAPQSLAADDGERRFARLHKSADVTPLDAEERLAKEARFDSDLWIVEIEDRAGRVFLDVVDD
jgi:hypothetical protein